MKKGPAKEEGCDEHKRGKGKKTKQPYAQRRTRATGAVINGIKGGGYDKMPHVCTVRVKLLV